MFAKLSEHENKVTESKYKLRNGRLNSAVRHGKPLNSPENTADPEQVLKKCL